MHGRPIGAALLPGSSTHGMQVPSHWSAVLRHDAQCDEDQHWSAVSDMTHSVVKISTGLQYQT